MANSDWLMYQDGAFSRSQSRVYSGSFTIGAAGAVSAQDIPGVTVAKAAAAGQYTLTANKAYAKLNGNANMVGPAVATPFPTTTGSDPQWRGPALTTQVLTLQFKRTDTQADADAASGTLCFVTIIGSDG